MTSKLFAVACGLALAACGAQDPPGPNVRGEGDGAEDAGGGDDGGADATGDGAADGGGGDGPAADDGEADGGAGDGGADGGDGGGEGGDGADGGEGSDGADDGGADGTTGDPLPPPEGCDDPDRRSLRTAMPLGDTLFLGADDYLAFLPLGEADRCGVMVGGRPEGATADVRGAEAGRAGRLTPDAPGRWLLKVGAWDVEVDVRGDWLNADTFLNYNYTPVTPLAEIEGGLLVASPPSNAIQRVRWTDGGAEAADLIPTGGWPTSVVAWPGSGYALVAQTARDSLGFLHVESGRLEDAILVGDEPAGIIVDVEHEGGPVAFVTISGADRVAKVDLDGRRVIAEAQVGRDPRAMAYDRARGRLFVASLMSLNGKPMGLLQEMPTPLESRKDIAVIDVATWEVLDWVHEAGTMLRGLHLDGDATRLLVAVSHSRNDEVEIDADTRPHAHSLVVVDADPESRRAYEVVDDIDLDRRPPFNRPAASPYTIAPTPDGAQLLMTLSAGRGIMALDPVTLDEIARVPTGHDPRGLVFHGGRAWTTAWLDNALQGFELPLRPGAAPEPITVPIGDDPTPPDIKNGQRVFNDAAFSKHGDFSCNNCHIDGVVDGLTWDLLVDGNVNTLAFRNVAGTNPFLWGGLLPTLFDFSREVLKLVGADATGRQMEDLTRYMQSVTAPPNPYALPGGRLSEQAQRGKELFSGAAGCGGCHSGPLYTSQQIERGKTPGLRTDVPALIGVYDSAPYGRQGQWATLEEMVDYALEFTGAELDDDGRGAVLQYVREIPGDALYLNAARPLSGDRYAPYASPIELTFSQVLAPEQEELFAIVTDADDEPVAGTWRLSGRVARFRPASAEGAPDEPGALEQETDYRISVQPGLRSAMGRNLYEALDITFRTGGEPAFDISGRWRTVIRVENPIQISQGADLAFIQSDGGHLTGVLLTNFDEGSLSHVDGSVSGTRLQLDPFQVETDLIEGPVRIDGGWAEMEDTDGDGFADRGEGEVTAFGFVGFWTLERASLPGEE